LWKRELQKLANELGLDIVVSHLPARTGAPSRSSAIACVIVELISATTTKTGLTVRCQLDTSQYPSGVVVSDAEMAGPQHQTCRVPR